MENALHNGQWIAILAVLYFANVAILTAACAHAIACVFNRRSVIPWVLPTSHTIAPKVGRIEHTLTRACLAAFKVRRIDFPIAVKRMRVAFNRARLVTLWARYQGPSYAAASIRPLVGMVRAFLRARAGSIGTIWTADVQIHDDGKAGYSTTVVVPFAVMPAYRVTKDGPSMARQYVIHVLSMIDRYSIMLCQLGLVRTPWTPDVDVHGLRTDYTDRRWRDALNRLDKIVRFAGHPEGITVTILWSDHAPARVVGMFHSWICEYTTQVRNTRGSGRSTAKGTKIEGQSSDRLQAWHGITQWSWHGRSFPGVSSMARILAYTVPIPVGYLAVCPACGVTREGKGRTCVDCGRTLVRTWTSYPGRFRAHFTGRDRKVRSASWERYCDRWNAQYETAIAPFIADAADIYAGENSIDFEWTATRAVRELNRVRKLEHGC